MITKKTILLLFLLGCVSRMSAQEELQRLMTTYTKSIRLPFYKECKEYDNRIPKSVSSVTLDDDFLTIKYVVNNNDIETIDRGITNTYIVRIELSKTLLSDYSNEPEWSDMKNSIVLICHDGIEIIEENGTTGEKHPFLIERWSVKCNDSPLCRRLLNAFKQFKWENVTSGNSGSTFKKNGTTEPSQSGGNSWSLAGRSLLGRLAQPSYKGDEQGKIVVCIRVDAEGRVVEATIGTGTTIVSETMRRVAIEAAKKNRFSKSNTPSVGTITYNFV